MLVDRQFSRRRRLTAALTATGSLWATLGLGQAPNEPVRLPAVVPAVLQQPADLAAQPATATLDVVGPETVPIDLATALALASGQNPRIGIAQQRIAAAYARLDRAQVMWVPSLRAGMNYNKHEGTIQDVAGRMIETSRGSVYSGLGAAAVGAGSPAVPGVSVNFHMADAMYEPAIRERLLAASRQAGRATCNDVLLETALAYNALLEAMQVEAVARETLANAQRLADLTGEFARVGQGLPSDADRAQVELSLRQVEVARAAEAVRVASVSLAFALSGDMSLTLQPTEPALVPVELSEPSTDVRELVATALVSRPELAESRLLVDAAVQRLRREQHAPLVPSVLLGLSYGGNGGGLGSDITDYGDRLDFDAVAYWEVRNLGWGEQAARQEACAELRQAKYEQVRVMDQVAAQVAQAQARVAARQQQVALAEAGIAAARDSYQRNSDRIRDALGLPIEVLQAVQALDVAQRQYVRCVADYNRAQFELQHALGWSL